MLFFAFVMRRIDEGQAFCKGDLPEMQDRKEKRRNQGAL